MPERAFADDEAQSATTYELMQQLEEATAAYEEAQAEVERINQDLEDNEARIADLEELLPAQQKKGEKAARVLYKFNQDGVGFIDFLLGAQSFYDFITGLDYINRITEASMAEINELAAMREELDTRQSGLAEEQDKALKSVEEAEEALAAAQAAKEEADRRAAEEARLAEEARAAAAALAANPRNNDQGTIADQPKEEEKAASDESSEAEPEAESGGGNTNGGPAAAESPSDYDSFVNMWAPRIDAYLAGSPLAGQGRTFAVAAYNYSVDPRWSPAISCIESSKGRYCFKPYNAWGWGSASWGSWEEAINAHVAGLSRGYGYSITVDGAKKYCPPNWEFWYNNVSSQMNLI